MCVWFLVRIWLWVKTKHFHFVYSTDQTVQKSSLFHRRNRIFSDLLEQLEFPTFRALDRHRLQIEDEFNDLVCTLVCKTGKNTEDLAPFRHG